MSDIDWLSALPHREPLLVETATVLTTADLHLSRGLYDQLSGTVDEHRPDIVALAGDYLDASVAPSADRISPSEAARRLKSLPCSVVLVRGNHEEDTWLEFEKEWGSAPWRSLCALHGTYIERAGVGIVGFPCWVGDDSYYGVGRRRRRNYDPRWWLTRLISRYKNSARMLWLMHEPPDHALGDEFSFCPEWAAAVDVHHPQVVVSGHDHATSIATGTWWVERGKTICINVGQHDSGPLRYCILRFERGKVVRATAYEGRRDIGGKAHFSAGAANHGASNAPEWPS